MKNRKLYQLLMASVISATVLTSGIGVSAADFSDSAVETSVSEDETPVAEESEEFSSDAAEAASAIAVNTTNFPDKKFYSYVLNYLDTNKDKKLSDAEIKAVQTLNVSGLGISNLKGIEYFTSLTTLDASNNKLTSVNLTKNTKLTRINVSDNALKGTLNLSRCTGMVAVLCSNNKLTKIAMPNIKYLKKLDYINASHNNFTSQANLGLSNISSDYLKSLTEIDVSYNALTSFNCSGFAGLSLNLANNKITKLSGGNDGYQVAALYIEGNSLSQTSSVDFTPEWVREPQRFSCDSAVRGKVKMVKAKVSASASWDEISLNIGSTSQDASYTLERKAGNGAYQTIKTWGKGDLDDPEFGDSYTDSNVTPGTTYTYRLTATVMVQDKNKVEQPWTGTAEVKARAVAAGPAISVKSSKAKTATVKWAAVKGADGYQVYYGTSKNKMNSAVTKDTKSLSVTKTGLGSKKTYYFRARAYKVVNGKKVYTSWSGVKAVKVK